jgi:GMP synthase-like glutamine amidotransferase
MSDIRFHILQHVSFEVPGYLEEWIRNKNLPLSFTKMFEKDQFPAHNEYDVLIVLGGPMGVNDEDAYPWLKAEKIFISEAIALDKKILGICLGSQLLACVLGAKVYPNKYKEIGFFPVSKSINESPVFDGIPDTTVVFQWHGDTFDLPRDAIRLASSATCLNQAFLWKKNVLGLQFHWEITKTLIQSLIQHGNHELIEKPYIQSEKEIVAGFQFIPTCNLLLENILENFFDI